MIIQELKILSEGLWESVKSDLKFFSPIQLFIKKLSELSYLDENNIDEGILYIKKIEDFFDKYRSQPGSDTFYISPHLVTSNDDSVRQIFFLLKNLKALNKEALRSEIENITIKIQKKSRGDGKIFIGHGRSKLWARLQLYIKDDLLLSTVTFEDESRTSETIINILSNFLNEASFAILIMTAEDETSDGNTRARQNVIHEAGLFQGRLGFDKVIILKQDSIEEFSNIAGLQYIPFSGDNIEQTFYEIQRKFKKIGLLK